MTVDKNKQSFFAPDKEHMFLVENDNSSANNGSDRDNEIDELLGSLYKELKKGVKAEAYGEIKQKVDALLLTLAQKMKEENEEEIERQKQELYVVLSTHVQEMKRGNKEKKEEKKRRKKKNKKKREKKKERKKKNKKKREKEEKKENKKRRNKGRKKKNKENKIKKEENGRFEKDCKIVIMTFLILFFIVVFLSEYVFSDSNSISTIIFGSGGQIIIYIVNTYSKKKKKIADKRKSGKSIIYGIVDVVMGIYQTIKDESLLQTALLTWCIIVLGVCFGRVGPLEATYEFAAARFNAIKDIGENVILAAQVGEEVEAVVLAECDGTTINMLQQADITQAELYTIKKLSQKNYDLVFYLNRKNIDWTNQNAVNETVLQMIAEMRSMQMENEFDKDVSEGGAPYQLRELIYQVSKDEINAVRFSEIEAFCDVRADVFNLYPKKSLANLLSNDYQKLANILYLNGGNEESILYYYSQSIIRDFECLQFAENSNDMVKGKLISIARRYKDIIYTCPNMEGLENAQALAVAFENAAKQY